MLPPLKSTIQAAGYKKTIHSIVVCYEIESVHVAGHMGGNMSTSSRPQTAERRIRSIARTLTLGTAAALLVQFLAGMTVNLFVELPKVHPGSQAKEYFSGVVESIVWAIIQGKAYLQLHVLLGLLLVLSSSSILVLSIATKQRKWVVAGIMGWVGTIGAGFNGGSYLNYGHELSSFLMAVGFLMAIISYAIVFHVSSRST
jgi:hypothetical protein